jgi:hypothetical protein
MPSWEAVVGWDCAALALPELGVLLGATVAPVGPPVLAAASADEVVAAKLVGVRAHRRTAQSIVFLMDIDI